MRWGCVHYLKGVACRNGACQTAPLTRWAARPFFLSPQIYKQDNYYSHHLAGRGAMFAANSMVTWWCLYLYDSYEIHPRETNSPTNEFPCGSREEGCGQSGPCLQRPPTRKQFQLFYRKNSYFTVIRIVINVRSRLYWGCCTECEQTMKKSEDGRDGASHTAHAADGGYYSHFHLHVRSSKMSIILSIC